MPIARSKLVSVEATPFYHLISRCCRQCYILGKDAVTKKDYSHRQEWIENRLEELPSIFNIKVASYAIMSNHFHLVVFVDKDESSKLSDLQVIERWHKIYNGTVLTQKYAKGELLSEIEMDLVKERADEFRSRLMDLGWFMKCINEPLARSANREDNCTGKFWEGRFKSQALLDEKALLACMAYVDLNPVRAKMAKTPEKSAHTSIKKRIEQSLKTDKPNNQTEQVKGLLNFVSQSRQDMPKGIPCKLTSYIELVEWTGRQSRKGKAGKIDSDIPELMQRLNIDPVKWAHITSNFESSFKGIVGESLSIIETVKNFGRERALNVSNCLYYFGKQKN
ncbi:transposase [Marinicellulosiphila megalodicopiae]|uniref:transposase n=1 Tax=Marinicellulosiphila megalodicopiae TaxID=2724896 RepID=UPI003BB1B67A